MDDLSSKAACRDARRQAIIETARDVFLKEGFAATSMSAVAARVGGSKGTLYNYFDSKETLFSAVIQDRCERGQAAIFDFDPQSGDIVAALRTLGERYLQVIASDAVIALNRLVIGEAVRFPEIGRILYESGHRRGVQLLAAYIESATGRSQLNITDSKVAAEQFMDLCVVGIYKLRLFNAAPPPSQEEISLRVDIALKAFMAQYGAPTKAGAEFELAEALTG